MIPFGTEIHYIEDKETKVGYFITQIGEDFLIAENKKRHSTYYNKLKRIYSRNVEGFLTNKS